MDDLGGGIHPKGLILHSHRVAQVHLFQERQILIAHGLFQLEKGNGDAHCGHTDLVALHIALRPGLELLRRGRHIEVGREIHRGHPGALIGSGGIDDGRVAHHQVFAVGICPIGIDAGEHFGNVAVLLNVGEIFAIPNGNAIVLAPFLVEPYGKTIPLVFPAVHIQNTARLTAQDRPGGRWHLDGPIGHGVLISPEGKCTGDGCIGLQGHHGRRCAACGAGIERYVQQVIRDMPGVKSHLAAHGLGVAVNAERLCRSVRAWDGVDQTFVLDLRKVDAGHGIHQLQLIHAIALLGDRAGDGCTQGTQALGGKTRRIRREQNRDHKVHHLGVICTAVIPPE